MMARILRRMVLLAVLGVVSVPASAQVKKPDTDPDSPIVNRALRFAGEAPPFRIFVEYPWFAGEGQVPAHTANGAVARTVLEWTQQFSNLYARAETDPNWRARTAPARLEVSYRVLRPTARLVCILYTRTVNDGRTVEDRVSMAIDLFDISAYRPVGIADLLEGDRWLTPAAERVEAALREEAERRKVALFGSLQVRDWLRDTARWQFERRTATIHFAPGEVAVETAGRFEVALPYAIFGAAIRRRGALGALAPKEDAAPPADHDRPRRPPR